MDFHLKINGASIDENSGPDVALPILLFVHYILNNMLILFGNSRKKSLPDHLSDLYYDKT